MCSRSMRTLLHLQLLFLIGAAGIPTPNVGLRLRLRGGSGSLFNPKLCPEGWVNQAVLHWRGRPHSFHSETFPQTRPDPQPESEDEEEEAGGAGVQEQRGAGRADVVEGVQRTNDDSTVSKRSAAEAGYVRDEFVQMFCGNSKQAPARRTALINRGYYVRMQAMRRMIRSFIAAAKEPVQVLVLGAGFDSTFLQLKAEGALDRVRWCEVDMPGVVSRKRAHILSKPRAVGVASGEDMGKHGKQHAFLDFRLQQLAIVYGQRPDHASADLGDTPGEIHTGDYHVVGADLRNPEDMQTKLMTSGAMSRDVPTLVVAECVLQYLQPQEADGALAWACQAFDESAAITYDQIGPSDAFGQGGGGLHSEIHHIADLGKVKPMERS
ncbi:S-adenosyl-L-methionine-dependent methyltransferase [Baffinella frigidus]|nr:S-adenosyl-L-methionine-dependent methyltransferase [Cryptophyta sp. CCMP2293]